jgi:hypothetical protein
MRCMIMWTSGFRSLNRLTSRSIVRPSGPVNPFQYRIVICRPPARPQPESRIDTIAIGINLNTVLDSRLRGEILAWLHDVNLYLGRA